MIQFIKQAFAAVAPNKATVIKMWQYYRVINFNQCSFWDTALNSSQHANAFGHLGNSDFYLFLPQELIINNYALSFLMFNPFDFTFL